MNFIDVVRSTATNAHHKYDSINKIKVKIMELAKQDKHEYCCNYNDIDKNIIKELRNEGFDVAVVSAWKRINYIIKW